MIGAFFSLVEILLGLLLLVGLGLVLANSSRRLRTEGFGWLRTEGGLSSSTNVLLLVLGIALAVEQNRSSAESAARDRVLSSHIKQLSGGAFEYLEWRYAVVPNGADDFDLRILARKRETTHEFKAYDLRIVPVFLDRTTGRVDDGDAISGRMELHISSAVLPPRRLSSREARIDVSNLLTLLRRKYDGDPLSTKFRQANKYRLYAFQLRAKYWHAHDGPEFSMDAYSFRNAIVGNPSPANPFPHTFKDKGWGSFP